jgi:hypothetical protein
VERAYFLSGSINALGEVIDFNHYTDGVYATVAGTRKTTQELNRLPFGASWGQFGELWRQSSVPFTSNTMIAAQYPYPSFLNATTPNQWPVATNPASRLVYLERYAGGSMGFYPPMPGGLPPLRDDLAIIEAGYAAIVPRAGGYSVRQSGAVFNSFVEAESHFITVNPDTGEGYTLHLAVFTGFVYAGASPAAEVLVNDNSVEDAGSRFVNTSFAKGIFTNADPITPLAPRTYHIRTPQQLLYISSLLTTANITFMQERSLDFNGLYVSGGAVVRNVFNGIYDGGGNSISNVHINAPALVNVGLFSQNAGTVRNIGVHSSSFTGYSNVGGIAGSNSGTVEDVFFLSANGHDDIPVTAVRTAGAAGIAGGIVGDNTATGTVNRALYIAPAPERVVDPQDDLNPNIFPIVGNGEATEENLFLRGARYFIRDGEPPDDTTAPPWPEWVTDTNDAAVRLPYNRPDTLDDGGTGLTTAQFMDFADWVNDIDEWSRWHIFEQPDPPAAQGFPENAAFDYPYPRLRRPGTPPLFAPVPPQWPVTAAP